MLLNLKWYWWVLIVLVVGVIVQYARMKSGVKLATVATPVTLGAAYFPFNGVYTAA